VIKNEQASKKNGPSVVCCESFPLLIKNRKSERAEVFVIITDGGIRRQIYEFYNNLTIIPNTGKFLSLLSLGARVFVDVVSVGSSRLT
jgi:hypothetical protein